MKRECLLIASFISLVAETISSQVVVDQPYYDEEPGEYYTDDMYAEEHYYEEYEEEVEYETLEYEDFVEFEDGDYDYFDYYEDDEDEKQQLMSELNCYDEHDDCDLWASVGECDNNPTYMRRMCRFSCNTCHMVPADGKLRRGLDVMTYEELIELDTADDSYNIPECVDRTPNCPRLASQGECGSDPDYMERTCPQSCKHCQNSQYHIRGVDLGVPQSLVVDGFTRREDITWMIGKARNYIKHYIEYEEDPDVLSWCWNEHRLCAFWALYGECEKNSMFMKNHCGPVCGSCGMDYEIRCPLDPDAKPAWEPGGLNAMFESIVESSGYEVNVLSSPESDGPWIVTIDNLLTEVEAKGFIELGYNAGYERSEQVGDINEDGGWEPEISEDRTSTNAWCTPDSGCANAPLAVRVLERIENLTKVPSDNGEYMQLLKYEPGQYYKAHHDYIDDQVYRMQGVRMLTVFLYLNEPEAGGATYFDELDLKVEPKIGRALIWPSTLDEYPDEIDPRLRHEAQEVTAGVKYAANVWYHMYSYKGAERKGCLE